MYKSHRIHHFIAVTNPISVYMFYLVDVVRLFFFLSIGLIHSEKLNWWQFSCLFSLPLNPVLGYFVRISAPFRFYICLNSAFFMLNTSFVLSVYFCKFLKLKFNILISAICFLFCRWQSGYRRGVQSQWRWRNQHNRSNSKWCQTSDQQESHSSRWLLIWIVVNDGRTPLMLPQSQNAIRTKHADQTANHHTQSTISTQKKNKFFRFHFENHLLIGK